MNIFTKTPQQLEEEAAAAAAAEAAKNASEEGDYSPSPVQESKTDAEGNALDPNILDRTGEVNMGEAVLANTLAAPDLASLTEVEPLPEHVPEVWRIEDARFGNTKLVEISTGTYGGQRLAIESFIETEHGSEPFARYTVNLGGGTPEQHVYVKNWSEGEGNEEVLLAAGIIEGEPIMYTPSGHVSVPLYRVTDKFWAFARSKGSVL